MFLFKKHSIFIKSVFLKPLFEQKKRLINLFFSLCVLSFIQVLLAIFIDPLLRSLFLSPNKSIFSLAKILPKSFCFLLPEICNFHLSFTSLPYVIALSLLLAGTIRSLCLFSYQVNSMALSLWVGKNYREKLFQNILNLPYLKICMKTPAQWMSHLMADVLQLQLRFSDVMNHLIRDALMVISAFIALSFVHLPTALCLFFLSPILAWGMGKTGKNIASYADQFQQDLSLIADHIWEIRSRLYFVCAQNGQAYENIRFQKRNDKYYHSILKSIFIRVTFAPLMELLGAVFFAAILWLVANGYLLQTSVSSQIFMFLGVLAFLFRPLRNVGEQLSKYQEIKGSLNQGLALFAKTHSHQKKDVTTLKTPKISLSEQNPSFQILKLKSKFLSSLNSFEASNLQVSPGTNIAIIGPSGAGKSLLIKTLAGLIEPCQWEASLGWEEWIHKTAFVSQDPFLFSASLRSNLLYGHHQTLSDEHLMKALNFVELDKEVSSFKEGLNFPVKSLRINLSGGQLQRLVIARAMLRDKAVWLFDEATSAVDLKAEKKIIENLTYLSRKRRGTLLAITHRMASLQYFDQIWFVEDGKIIEKGQHNDLLQKESYKKFCYAMQ